MARPLQRTQNPRTCVTSEATGPESGMQLPTRMTVAMGQGPMSREPREKEQRQDQKQTCNHTQQHV